MKRASLVAFVLGISVASFAQGKERAPKPLLVGVVDVGTVFKKYDRKEELERAINAKKAGFETKAQKQDEDVKKLRDTLNGLDPKTQDFRDKVAALNLKMATVKVTRDAWEAELKAEIEDMTLELLNDVEKAVARYAKANKFDLVIKKDSQSWGDERFQERIFRAQVQGVLYAEDALDLTDEIVEALNKKK